MYGNKLRKLRNGKEMSQQELADVFHIKKSSISMYENNIRTPNMELALDIAKYFEVSIDYMLGYIPKDNQELQATETIRRLFVKNGIMNEEDDLSTKKMNEILAFVKANKKFILTDEPSK